MEPSVVPKRPRALGPRRGAALYTRCEDCEFLIIKDSQDRWVLFFQVAPTGILDKPSRGWICEKTGKSHKPVDKSSDKV